MRGTVSRPVPASSRAATGRGQPTFDAPPAGLELGQSVNHPKFGEGVVLNYEGDGPHARVQVNFDAVGSKWLVLAYANLVAV